MEPKPLVQTLSSNFACDTCNYTTVRKSQYDRHISTAKHIFLTNPNNLGHIKKIFDCKCGKIYKHQPTLCYHTKTCPVYNAPAIEVLPELTNHFVPTPVPTPVPTQVPTPVINHDLMYAMFKELCASNAEFKQMIKVQHNIILDQQNKMTELSSIIESNNA